MKPSPVSQTHSTLPDIPGGPAVVIIRIEGARAATPASARVGYFCVIIAHHREPLARSRSRGTGDAENDFHAGDGQVLVVDDHSANRHGRVEPHGVVRGNLINAVLLGFRPTHEFGT